MVGTFGDRKCSSEDASMLTSAEEELKTFSRQQIIIMVDEDQETVGVKL
jgi:hypothetical protein